LCNCELTTESLVALATVLQVNDKVMSLNVARSLNAPLMEEATSHFSRMLKVNSTLMELDLSRCGIRDLGLQLLAEELYRATDTRLSSLLLTANQISLVDSECVNALALLLGSQRCRLETLLLGSNALRDEGTLKLADIVSSNASLVELDLTSNSITSRGLCALGRAISPDAQSVAHPKILHVSLWGNRFDSAVRQTFPSQPPACPLHPIAFAPLSLSACIAPQACVVWQPMLSLLELDFTVDEVDGHFISVRK